MTTAEVGGKRRWINAVESQSRLPTSDVINGHRRIVRAADRDVHDLVSDTAVSVRNRHSEAVHQLLASTQRIDRAFVTDRICPLARLRSEEHTSELQSRFD